MELHLLIAEPRQEQRELLRTIYSASPLVTRIDEAINSEELHYKLEHTPPDFVVVHQSLITDISLLPRGHFVILATRLDPTMLIAAYHHGGWYFLDNPLPTVMLLAALNPTGVAWVLEYLTHAESLDVKKVLTAREQTILALWNEGLSSSAIGKRLVITNGTVKNELANIRTKLQKHNILAIMRKGRVKTQTDI
jgi:DNA-binding NarL/FixJ family response regulator